MSHGDSPGTIRALDGIRALAILLVIPHNVDVLNGPLTPSEYPAMLLFHSGWVGVQLFFVLSGFLITGNLLDTRGAENYFSAFIARRALRILPLYFAVLCVVFVIAPLLFNMPAALSARSHDQIWLWTFLCNWTIPYGGEVPGFGHFWSLAVEEQFYLLWPLVVFFCPPMRVLQVSIATILGSILVRIALEAHGAAPQALYMFTPCRADALACGAAGAALLRMPQCRSYLARSQRKLAVLTIALLVLATLSTRGYAVYDRGSQTVGYTIIALAFGALVLLAALGASGRLARLLRPLSWPPLRRIGRYSYGMYVFHLPLHTYLGQQQLQRWFPEVTLPVALGYAFTITAVCLALAAVSYECFERHFLHLKERIAYKSATPAVAPGRY